MSLLGGIALVAGYFILIVFFFQLSLATVATLLQPMNMPHNIYKMIFGLYYGERGVVVVLNLIANLKIYIILTFSEFSQNLFRHGFERVENADALRSGRFKDGFALA